MNFKMTMIRENLLLFLALSAVTLWAFSSSILLIQRSDKTLLIGIDKNGTRIINQSSDPLLKYEVANFLKLFCQKLYNFNHITFSGNVGVAADLMSQELWKLQKDRILSLKKEVLKNKTQLTSLVKRIVKKEKNLFLVSLETNELKKLKSYRKKLDILIEVKSSLRTEENPWGLEVVKIEENIHN